MPILDQSFNVLFYIELIDFDAMLVRNDLPVSELKVESYQAQHFSKDATLGFPVLGQTIPFPRGWIAVDAKLRGKNYRVVTTHLETFNPFIQAAQADELIAPRGPLDTDVPVVLAGDLNSDADNPDPSQGPAYQILLRAGFADAWQMLRPGDPGFTWPLHGEDPSTAASSPYQRIDLILTRGSGIAARDIALVGNTLGDSQLWPSDHAGVLASFTLLPTQ